MSKGFIFRGGTVATQSFAATLGEINMPITPKKRPAHEAALARQKMLEDAKADARTEGHEEGYEAGQASGYKAGFDQAYAEGSNQQAEMLRRFAADLQQVHDRLEESIAEWFRNSEEELEEIGLQIAEKLVGAQLHLDRSIIVETTKAALHQLTEANTARIRVNPFDSVILGNVRDELLSANASLRGIEIVDDASIYGGCVIETDRGAIDATIETRLELFEGGMEEAA